MQTAAFALVCLLTGAASAMAAEPASVAAPQTRPAPAQTPRALSAPQQQPSQVQGGKPPEAPNPSRDAAAKPVPRRSDGRVCFNAPDTREKITTHRLTDPFRALRAGRFQGEPLRVRLCRWKPDEFVYEISVLRRDGRLVRVYMNATNGQTVGALNDNDHK